MKRIIWIDWAKSFCMFLVVLGHCHLQPSEQIVTQVIYSFHIPLFFFLSGLLCQTTFSITSLQKDIRNIIVPYFIFGILQIVFYSILSRDFSLIFYLSSLKELCIGNDASIGAIWFLPALFICKQLYHLAQWTMRKFSSVKIALIGLTFIPAYYITQYHIYLPLFADSALFGLPFFIIGSYSRTFIEKRICKSVLRNAIATIFLITLTVVLSTYNGFVSVAICNYGNNILLYYLNAITGIAAVIGMCILLNGYRRDFVTTTSYGTIVTLGLHGLILLILQYYIPKLGGFYTQFISFPIAILYTSITYVICFTITKWGDRYCPQLLGLKGNLSKILKSSISLQ